MHSLNIFVFLGCLLDGSASVTVPLIEFWWGFLYSKLVLVVSIVWWLFDGGNHCDTMHFLGQGVYGYKRHRRIMFFSLWSDWSFMNLLMIEVTGVAVLTTTDSERTLLLRTVLFFLVQRLLYQSVSRKEFWVYFNKHIKVFLVWLLGQENRYGGLSYPETLEKRDLDVKDVQ